MKKRLLSTFLCLCMALTLLPAPAGAAEGELTPGETYWFDLSGEDIPGTANALPDPTRHWVPFTYAGSVNAYALKSQSSGRTARDDSKNAAQSTDPADPIGYVYDHALFISDYILTHTVSWDDLNGKSLVFGKDYASGGVDYTLRSPSGGSYDYMMNGTGGPENNEWDCILGSDASADNGYIKNASNGTYSWVQDTYLYTESDNVCRGADSVRDFHHVVSTKSNDIFGFRPVLEPKSGALRTVSVDLGAATVGESDATGVIYLAVKAGAGFSAPGTDGLTFPTEQPFRGWMGSDGKVYAAKADVPAAVTSLSAKWDDPAPSAHTHALSVDCETEGEGVTPVTFTPLGDAATLTAGSYYLDADKELTAPLTVPDGETVDLCLNGHALKYVGINDTHSVITVGDGATLNLCDCNGSNGSHTVTSPVTNEAVTISGGLITGAHRVATQPETAGGAIYSKGDVNLYGGTVAGNKGYVGGGVHLNGKDKTAGLTFTMYGGQICHNESTYSGGGVYLYPCAADPANAGFVLHGGEIHHNKTNNAGGGLIASGTRTSILMDGGSIHHNTAGGRGGGLYSYASTTSLLGGSIHHNTTESDEAGGVYPSSSSGAVVTLGGDMTITDNTAAGGAASNLFALYQMTVQDGFTGQVGIHTRDDDFYLGRPFFRGAEGASLERKLGQFLPDVPGQCAELLTGENAGKLTLTRIAITTQPTAEAPAVGVNYAPEGIAYQWYTAQRRGEAVTDRNAAPYKDDGPRSAGGRYTASFDETSGTWTSSQYRQGENGGYFVIGMKAGDALTVTIPADQVPQIPAGQTWALVLEGDDSFAACFDPSETNSEGVTVATGADGAVTVTYPVPADGEYALMAYDLFYHDEEDNYVDLSTPVISAVWTHVVPVDAVTGQTAATLSAPTAGDYLCRVTWPDGTVLNSNPVTFAPPVTHTHAVSVDCETEGENLVTFKALTSRDGALYIDGKAAKEANRYYELPAGHYYLAEDVRLNKFIYALPGDAAALTFDLCLNGYKLECADASSVIYIAANKPFNLCDCNPTGEDRTGNVIDNPVSGYTEVIWGGVITGGTRAAIEQPLNASVTLYGGTIAGNNSSSVYGGGVHANHLVMHGGAIMYNKAGKGGGVYAIKSFTMTGGEISHNWADTEGGVKLGDSATATLSGNAVISDNEAGTGTAKAPSNLCLGTGRTVTVAPEGLGENADVGVTTAAAPTDASPVTVATPGEDDTLTADDLAKFSSDNSDYELKLSEGSIVLAKPAPYAITTQPTVANGYTVTASYPEKAHYQWYRSDDRAAIGRKIALEGAAFGSAAEDADYEGSTGHWSGTAKNGVCEFFAVNLKAGQLIYLSIESACKGKPFTLTGDNGETVTATPTVGYLYLPVPADGRYTLRVSDLIGTSATLFSAYLYPPLEGQTGATLIPAKGGSYFCMVTWDGTDQYEDSNSVTPLIPTTALTLEPETLALQVGQTEYLNATRTPSDANDDVTWASDNEGVATVNNSGRVEAVGAGTATITATANGITASCAVTVTPVPAITQQPKADNGYTVGVNYAPEGIFYQWYPATVTTADITPENADPFTEDGDPANFADGKWTVAEGDWYDGYFTTALKKDDMVAVTMATAEKPDEGVLGLIYENYDHGESYHLGYYFSDFEPDEGVTAAEDGDNTVITYIIPADGSYDLVLGPYGGDVAISAKLTHTELGEAVSGQTTAKLTAAQAGDYLCRVTWPDGTALNSDIVTVTTPPEPGEATGEVEVKGDGPAVTVDEDALKDLAGEVSNGDTVTVKLTVEKQDAPNHKDELEAVIAGKKDDVLYLDLSLVKQVNDQEPEAISDTGDKVLEIVVPYDFTGKKDVTVYRKHGSDPAAALDKADTKADGTYRLDEAEGKVYIYASKFSTYAIGYTAETAKPSRPVVVIQPEEPPVWPFVDVAEDDWFYGGVKYVYEQGLMEGTSSSTFAPAMGTSRAMIATIIWRLVGSPETEAELTYLDCVKDSWYAAAVAWGTEQGVVKGFSRSVFAPDQTITREQMAAMLARHAKLVGLDTKADPESLNKFADGDSTGDWAVDSVAWCVENGILKGKGGNVLAPAANVTRAEVAVMLDRFVALMK